MSKEVTWLLAEKYNGEASEAFLADCVRLEAGEPLAYVIGHVPFLDCTIHLDSHPLIPRPETEFWVHAAISEIKRASKDSLKILDVCAGSGAIGIAVAKATKNAFVTFAELDPSHLPTIQKNITTNLSSDAAHMEQYIVLESDLFSHVSGTFDFILTNPPYIDKAADTVAASVTAFEPHLALFGGQDGMEIISKIITEARASLKPFGQLWIEHEPFQSASISTLAKNNGFSCQTHQDQYDTERYSVLTLTVAE